MEPLVNRRGVRPNDYNPQSKRFKYASIRTIENSSNGRSDNKDLTEESLVHNNQQSAGLNELVFGRAQCINFERQHATETHCNPPAILPLGSLSEITDHLPVFDETFVNLYSSLSSFNSCASEDTYKGSDRLTLPDELLLKPNLYETCDQNNYLDLSFLPDESALFLDDNTPAQETYSAVDEINGFPDLSTSLDHAVDVNELLELIDTSLPTPQDPVSDFALESFINTDTDSLPEIDFDMEDMKETERVLQSFADYEEVYARGRLVEAATNTSSTDNQPIEMTSGCATPHSRAVVCNMDTDREKERRQKNNEASRRSRAKRKNRFKACEEKVDRLEMANLELKFYIERLDVAIQEAKDMLLLRI
nr:unnamed protein product [Spirometra erinaceieuropaei]